MKGHSRPLFHRVYLLADALRSGPVRLHSFAADNEICKKTAERDLEFLRDRLRYDVTFDTSIRAWRLIKSPQPRL